MKKAQKNKAKKLRLPLHKMTGQERDYAAAVLEEMRSDFRAFGEVLGAVKEKGDATFEEVGKINERLGIVEDNQILMQKDINVIKQDIQQINGRINNIDGRLDNIEKEVASIKSEIKELRLSLIKKADIEKLEKLELRVIKIEKYLKLSIA